MVTKQEVETKQLKDIVDLESFLKVTDQTREDINKQLEAQRLTPTILPFAERSEDLLGIKTYESEYIKLLKEAEDIAFNNQVKLLESIIGVPIDIDSKALGSDYVLDGKPQNKPGQVFPNILNLNPDIGLKGDLARSNDFNSRKKKFLEAYPDGEYIQVMLPLGDGGTKYPELYIKSVKDFEQEKEKFKFVNLEGLDKGDLGTALGTIFDEQFLAETGAYITVNKKGPLTKFLSVFAGARTGIELREGVETLRGYGENEYNDAVIDRLSFFNDIFLDYDDAINAGLSATLFSAGDMILKRLSGDRLLNVEGAKKLNEAAERLGLPPLLLAQLIANPAIRKSFYQAGEFTSTVENALRNQSDQVLDSLKKFRGSDTPLNEADLLEISKNLEGEMAKLIQFFPNQKVANEYEQFFNQLTDFYTLNQSDLTKSLTNKALKLTKINGEAVNTSIDFTYLKRNLSSEIQKNVKIRGEPKFDKDKMGFVAGDRFEVPTTASSDAQELLTLINKLPKVVQNFEDISRAIKPNQKNFENSFQALLNIRDKAYQLSKSTNSADAAIGLKVLNSVKEMMNPSMNRAGNYINGSPEFMSVIKIMNNNLTDFEQVMNYGFVKDLMSKTSDLDTLTRFIFNPDNKIAGKTLQKLMYGFDETPNPQGVVFENRIKQLFINHLINDPSLTGKRLKDWIAKDSDTLKYYLGDGAEEKIKQLQKIANYKDLMDNSIFVQALEKQGTDFEIITEAIKQANKNKIGTDKVLENLINQGGDNFVQSVRAGIIENALDKATKTAGTGQVGEILDYKILQREIDKILKNKNYLKFFDEDSISKLNDYSTYIARLREGGDVGGAITGATQRSRLSEFNPATLLEFAIVGFKNDILARILAKPGNTKAIIENVQSPLDRVRFGAILGAYDRLADEFGITLTEGDQINTGVFTQTVPVSSIIKGERFKSDTYPEIIERDNQKPKEDQTSQIPVNLLDAIPSSSLNNFNLANNKINTNIAAAGQRVFGTDDPVFSGIANTNVGRQVVA